MASHPPKEKRKVQISGKSSCMISLPKRWVREMGLVQGSPLTISRHNGTSLLITMDKNLGGVVMQSEKDVGTLFVSRPEDPDSILRKIITLYIQGYNMIKIRFSESSNSFLKSTIRELVRRQLIGVEIVSDTTNVLVLQILLGKSELTIDNAMKRMSIVSSTMLEESLAALQFSDKRRAHEVLENDEIERFGSYTSRQILGSLNHDFFKEDDDSEPEKLMVYLMISRAIENVARCGRSVAEQSLELTSQMDHESAEILSKLGDLASEIFDSSVLSFFKRDSKAAETTIDRSRDFLGLISASLDTLHRHGNHSTEHIVALVSAMESLKNVSARAVEIANLVLSLTPDQYVRTESSAHAVAGNTLMLERDQINVFS